MSETIRTASFRNVRASFARKHSFDVYDGEIEPAPPKRFCAFCDRRLAQLNPEGICYACQDRAFNLRIISMESGPASGYIGKKVKYV